MTRKAVVLLSGGLDSATTLAMAMEAGFECHALTVDYGQRHSAEIGRAVEIARFLGAASHRTVSLTGVFDTGSALTDENVPVPKSRSEDRIGEGIPVTYVPARNTVLLSLALVRAEILEAGSIFLGVNAVDYSGYPDCRQNFLEAFEAMAGIGTAAGDRGEKVRIEAPLLHMSKGEIVRKAVQCGVDLSLTLSCYDPGPEGKPCGSCDACILRRKGFLEAGIEDPTCT